MINLLTTIFLAQPNALNALTDFSNLSWSEVGAMLGVLTIIGGGFIKLIQRTDEKLKLRVDILENDLKEKFKECKEHLAEIEKRVTEDKEKDGLKLDRVIEKIEARIEKLSDLIIKLIEKN